LSHKVDSDALDELLRTLGIAGGGRIEDTLLDSGNLSLVVNANEIIRRSRTPGVTNGNFYGILQNEHVGAGQLASSLDPYDPGNDVIAPYPAPVPAGFDVWLLAATTIRVGAGSTLDGAVLAVDPAAIQQGWGRDNLGALVTGDLIMPVALWTGFDTSTANVIGVQGDGNPTAQIGRRLQRGAELRFISDVAGALVIQCIMVIGVFPVGLGQDIASQ